MDLYQQLTRDEGSSHKPYTDTVGKLTIGVGRNLTDVGVSDAEIQTMLQNDVENVLKTLSSRLPYFAALDTVRQAVLANMCFNLGFGRLEGFHDMLQAVAQGNWEDAAKEMLDSTWATEVGDRAKRLAQQMTSGVWV
jgi:lysozyme